MPTTSRAGIIVAGVLFVVVSCRPYDRSASHSQALGGATYGGDLDAGPPVPDADAWPIDAGLDGGLDAWPDGSLDAWPDAGGGAPGDASLDAFPDGRPDGGVDAPRDAFPDGPPDGGVDAPIDSGVCMPYSGTDSEDICYQVAQGLISSDEVGQETLDDCACALPTPSSCTFTTYPGFLAGTDGCHVTEPSFGDLGDVNDPCPVDVYEQQELCAYMISTLSPIPPPIDAEDYVAEPQEPPTPAPNNEFSNPAGPDRNVVVLGSSMMSTHNQANNGAMCNPGNAQRPETTSDQRGLRGNDFRASPAWNTRVPWRLAFAGGRTGFNSDDVRGAAANKADACGNPWGMAQPPMTAGVNWFAGKTNKLMVTDGGLINNQDSTTGGWSNTLEGLVTCQAIERAVPLVNALLDAEHRVLNPNPLGVRVNGRWRARNPSRMRLARTVPQGGWAGALDLPGNVRQPRCRLTVMVQGNGRIPRRTMNALARVGKDVPPLIRLWTGGPPMSPVPGNLAAIKNAYTPVSKQVWLQYPYMDQARVTIRGSDLGLLFNGRVAQKLLDAWGRNAALGINAIDPGSVPRIRQVTDDLNKLMYDSIGCNAVAAFAAGHPARVCARDAAKSPLVVITQDNFAGWGPGDHQDTIIGGMPHESAAGANKLGAAIVAADGLP